MKWIILFEIFLVVASITGLYLGLVGLSYLVALARASIVNLVSIVAVLVPLSLCVVSIFFALRLAKVRIKKETYWFILLVICFCASFESILNLVLQFSFPTEWIVTISIILATPMSCSLAGYSRRTFWSKLKNLGLDQGMTILMLVILASVPIIKLTVEARFYSTGTVITGPIFQIGNSTAISKAAATGPTFSVDIPLVPGSLLVGEQIAIFRNRANAMFNINISAPIFSGNISGIKQFTVGFISDNGNRTYPISFKDSRLDIEEGYMQLDRYTNVSIELTCLVETSSLLQTLTIYCQMYWNQLSMNIVVV